MKLYVAVETKIRQNGEQGDSYDLSERLINPSEEQVEGLIRKADDAYRALSRHDQMESIIEVQEYDLDDSTDIADEDEIVSAMCNACGYDTPFCIDFESIKKEEEDDE